MNRKSLSKWKQIVFRVTLSKKILLGFVLAVVIAIVAFQVFKPIFAILVILLQAVIIYALIDRYLIKPIRGSTLEHEIARLIPDTVGVGSSEEVNTEGEQM